MPTTTTIMIAAVAALATAETLVEHEYGMAHNQMDDGTEYSPHVEVPRDDPAFAQGYFLTEAAEDPKQNARCLDGTPALYYHRVGTGSGANKW
jgi:hypothetical protein